MDIKFGEFGVFFFLAAGAIALFGFLAVATWSEERRKEREAFYKSEVLRKLADAAPGDADRILTHLREEEDADRRQRIEGLKLGGLVTTAVGVGLAVFLALLVRGHNVWAVGLVPGLIGLSLWGYGVYIASKGEAKR